MYSYPIGVPEIIIPKNMDVIWTSPEDVPYKGILKVRIIPPRDLLLPVVPIRCDDLLLFCLCFRCAKNYKKRNTKCSDICPHSDKEREFTATLTSIELEEALKRKYIVKKFYRAWHYTQFSDNLFKEYIK